MGLPNLLPASPARHRSPNARLVPTLVGFDTREDVRVPQASFTCFVVVESETKARWSVLTCASRIMPSNSTLTKPGREKIGKPLRPGSQTDGTLLARCRPALAAHAVAGFEPA